MSTLPSKKSNTLALASAGSGDHAPLPFHKQVVAGGTAGIIEILAMYPTDVIKTRAQLSKERVGMVTAFKNIWKNEGPGTFYRGIISPM